MRLFFEAIQRNLYLIRQEITKRAGEKWNSMSEEEKAPYVAQAQETRLKWEKQLQIYKHELKIGVKNLINCNEQLTFLLENGRGSFYQAIRAR